MGRKKAHITPITSTRLLRSTFLKRGMIALKKAMELSIMCGAQISMIIMIPNSNHVADYCSNGDMELFMWHYLQKIKGRQGSKTFSNGDYTDLWPSEGKGISASKLFPGFSARPSGSGEQAGGAEGDLDGDTS